MFIIKRERITLSPFFTVAPKTGVRVPKTGVRFYFDMFRFCCEAVIWIQTTARDTASLSKRKLKIRHLFDVRDAANWKSAAKEFPRRTNWDICLWELRRQRRAGSSWPASPLRWRRFCGGWAVLSQSDRMGPQAVLISVSGRNKPPYLS